MKKIVRVLMPFTMLLLLAVSCVNNDKGKDYIKKVVLNQETIAVGIYKATSVNSVNTKYIAEALNIDGGIVYVTLTDTDVLKTKLENIDVIIFPEIEKGQTIDKLDDKVVEILKNFISKKGAIGLCNGCSLLLKNTKSQTLDLVDLSINNETPTETIKSRVRFNLTEDGEKIFPDLIGFDNLYVNYCSDFNITKLDTTNGNKIIGFTSDLNVKEPLFITKKYKSGKIFITNTHPETTPGMRWMLPRIVRWVYNKKFIAYNKKVYRPDHYSNELLLDQENQKEIEALLVQLENGKKDEILKAMDELQIIYPYGAAEKVRALLIEKNSNIKLRAAKYLVDMEYTFAIEDMRKLVKSEKSRKVKEQLYVYLLELENMTEQN
ncbi:MAG: hypothetical protein KAR57_07200 [Bacteroidales bacterium]|nr:hypothetical protein [Bacteroidales bacterium]